MRKNKDEQKQIFDYLDKNEKGVISKKDLTKAIRYLGIIKSQNDFSFLLKNLDDEITFEQYSQIIQNVLSTEIKSKELERAFETFDLDKSQKINKDNFLRVLSVAGEKLDEEDLKLFMEYANIKEGSKDFNYINAVNNMIGLLKIKDK